MTPSHPDPLRTPDFTERLIRAADAAQLKPQNVRDALREIGIEIGEKSIYKYFDGTTQRTTPRMLAGLAKVLGTDVRWFCEPDDDGALYRALRAHWDSSQVTDTPDLD